ncbi:MAG: hypothetical protein JWO31_445 [Phycisphaerales bacterium]|nr:hypothetical protein [Phycisphaerales bacterium]
MSVSTRAGAIALVQAVAEVVERKGRQGEMRRGTDVVPGDVDGP